MKSCKLPPQLKDYLEKYRRCQTGPKVNGIHGDSRCRDTLRNEMEAAGAESLGAGVNRMAWRYNGCVVKAAKYPASLDSNTKELNTYRNAPRLVRNLFVPVADHDRDGWWLTMPLAQVGAMKMENRSKVLRRIKMKLEQKGLYCNDLHDNNVGKWRGKDAITDYDSGIGECSRHQHQS